jgi:hypothetical protein
VATNQPPIIILVVLDVLGEVVGVVFAGEVLRVLFAGRLDVIAGGLDVIAGGLDVFAGGLDVFAGGLLGVLGGGVLGELGTGNEPWTYTVLETHRTCYKKFKLLVWLNIFEKQQRTSPS